LSDLALAAKVRAGCPRYCLFKVPVYEELMSQPNTVKVLIVTDTPEALTGIKAMLAPEPGIDVIGMASSQAEAAQVARSSKPDITVVDYDMLGLDAAETTRVILREAPRVQVIMLSVVNDAADIRHAMRAGARDYLIKPLAEGELIETIRWLIRERREFLRMQSFVKQLRKAYEAIFTDDAPVPDAVIAFLEQQIADTPEDRLVLETLAVSYARNRSWEKLRPIVEQLARR
jgi:DNA-binding NarL/FixJ family response regulator